jgi:hypothetical protein
MYRYPAVLSGSEIKRRLGVSSRTALLLKRRLQLFFSDLMPAVREEFKEELEKRFKNFDLPEEGEDVSSITAVRPVLNMDTVALFSASQRANGGRSRHRHTGQTASIYLSDKVAEEKGKYQIGTLCHTMAIKNGPVILDCIPDQKQRTIQPLLSFLPSQVPIFTDEGYPWLSKYNKNHRAVNHSARAKDKKRNVWGRNRWCKKGVHNQAAEGFQRNLKHSFIAGYSYGTPQFAPLYLNEYAGIKSLKHYGLDTIAARRLKMRGRGECDQETVLTFLPIFPTPLEHLNGILPLSALRELADCRDERQNTKSINSRLRFSEPFPHISNRSNETPQTRWSLRCTIYHIGIVYDCTSQGPPVGSAFPGFILTLACCFLIEILDKVQAEVSWLSNSAKKKSEAFCLPYRNTCWKNSRSKWVRCGLDSFWTIFSQRSVPMPITKA